MTAVVAGAAAGAISLRAIVDPVRGTPSFGLNEQVVYPSFGVGRIKAVAKMM